MQYSDTASSQFKPPPPPEPAPDAPGVLDLAQDGAERARHAMQGVGAAVRAQGSGRNYCGALLETS